MEKLDFKSESVSVLVLPGELSPEDRERLKQLTEGLITIGKGDA